MADASSRGRDYVEAEWMCLLAFASAVLGGLAPAYTYGRETDVVVPCPGKGVGSGNRTPVGDDVGGSGGQTSPVPISLVRLL